ncbi:hypothetical protein ACSNN9_22755, partial [Micromonospora sp. URMC 107]
PGAAPHWPGCAGGDQAGRGDGAAEGCPGAAGGGYAEATGSIRGGSGPGRFVPGGNPPSPGPAGPLSADP